ncbi:MAG: hypothetical protein NZL93_05875, partial [Chthoniobacterales bacterium]|nr:hypothetical protein [Chthoniobacterales bacterium]
SPCELIPRRKQGFAVCSAEKRLRKQPGKPKEVFLASKQPWFSQSIAAKMDWPARSRLAVQSAQFKGEIT